MCLLYNGSETTESYTYRNTLSLHDALPSYGGIRTERALHFAGLMAVMFAGKSPEEFGEAIASGKTTRFGFDQPFPVYVAYWTMVPDGKGDRKSTRLNSSH